MGAVGGEASRAEVVLVSAPVHAQESPRHKLHRELLEAGKTLESWATDDTSIRQCRAYLNAAELVRQAARSIPLDEEEVKR